MTRARFLCSDGQCLRQRFASSLLSMPSASMIILAPSSHLIACLRRLVMCLTPRLVIARVFYQLSSSAKKVFSAPMRKMRVASQDGFDNAETGTGTLTQGHAV